MLRGPHHFAELQADNINTLVNAAGIKMEPYWAGLFSKLFANKNIGDLIANVGAGELIFVQLK